MKIWMLGALTILVANPATAAGKIPTFDIKAAKPYLLVEHDGKGHYIVHVDVNRTPRKKKIPRLLFYGNGKVFHQVQYAGRSGNMPKRGDFSYSISDPRVDTAYYVTFRRRHGESEIECGRRKTGLTRLPEGEAKRMVAKAKFYGPYWRRRSELLARDDEGRYFFVDRHHDIEVVRDHYKGRYRDQLAPKRGFRLYVGPRGRMKRVKLKNLVVDPAGEIFITAAGKLKRVASTKKVTWTEGGKTVELTPIDLRDARTSRLIYRHLGPYRGARMGRPCDDL